MEDFIKEYQDKLPLKVLDDFKKEVEARKLTKEQTKKVLEHIKQEYDKAKIHPGEAIGVITAESFGEPGTQMSIQHDEKIIIKIRDKIKVVGIGKLIDGFMETWGSLKINKDSEVLPLRDIEMYVPSLNQDEKVEWKRVTEFSRHKPYKKLLQITTASGRVITATDNHSFVTRVNNNIIPIKGHELNVGDRIPVLNNFFPPEYKTELSIHDHIGGYGYVDKEGMLHGLREQAKKITNNIPLDALSGWFTGAYLAEGNPTSHTVSITNIDDHYIQNASDFVQRLSINGSDRFYDGEYGPSRSFTVNSTTLSLFIESMCGKGANHKYVPQFAYSAPDAFVAGLLRGYFDGDGNFHVDRKMIRVSSNSKELRDGIALLLSRFKIFSFKITDNKGQHWVLIPYKYAPLYLAHIGSDIEYKRKDLEVLAERAKHFWNEKSQDYTDMISGFDDLFLKTAKKVGYPTRYVNNFTKRQKIGRTALFRYMKLFEHFAEKKGVVIKEELAVMQRMFTSDVIWDSIISLTYVEDAHPYVYDVSVPGLETFTTADGIITHNTLNVFHFAGVAEVSVTQGLPRLIEILDARKAIHTPSMEIYLKKEHAKDPLEVKRIATLIKETSLKEVVTEFSINLNKLQLEMALNKQKLKDLKITPDELVNILTENLKTVKVKREEDVIILKLKTAENELMETYKLKEKLKDLYIKGVKDISHVLPVKNQNEFMIITAGSNLKDVLTIPEVDEARTYTNDIFEINEVLGIEAARGAIMKEVSKVIEDQGLDVDVRHIMLIADLMTIGGVIKGITRSGITGEKRSVLAKASFETPLKHIINASLVGEEDELNSVIENVMLNQPIPLGTGLPDLVTKMKASLAQQENEKKK